MSRIVFLGDSVTASANVALADRWAQKVGLSAGYASADIINAGVPGNISQQMLDRLQADVLVHCPAVVVMMFTVNDRGNSIALSTHEANYRSLIEQCMAAGAKVTLLSPPVYRSQLDTWGAWVEKWRDLAGEYGCVFIDIWRDYSSLYLTGGFTSLYVNAADLVHQNAAGNARIHAVAMSLIYAGAFVPNTLSAPTECTEGVTAKQLALLGLMSVDRAKLLDAIQHYPE